MFVQIIQLATVMTAFGSAWLWWKASSEGGLVSRRMIRGAIAHKCGGRIV
jgi:hypothetical protein